MDKETEKLIQSRNEFNKFLADCNAEFGIGWQKTNNGLQAAMEKYHKIKIEEKQIGCAQLDDIYKD